MKRIIPVVHFLSLFSLFLAPAVFAQKAVEYTSPDELARDAVLQRDFNIQGEYLGKMQDFPFGVNAIADGKGRFRVVVFYGGLPGDGWRRGDTRIFGKAVWNDPDKLEVVLEEIEENGTRCKLEESDDIPMKCEATVEKGQLLARLPDEENLVVKKVERKSPSFDRAPEEGALVLFKDGKLNEEMWVSGKVNEEAETLWAEASTKPFEKRPYAMHIEFMLSYMPEAKGQARSNSGVYIDEAYECQVLDSFGLDGKNNECGGFYTVAEPKVNMCFPPLRWQTYDIEFTPATFDDEGAKTAGARIRIVHNGVVIHEGIHPEKETPGRKKETPESRGLYLQGHGNKVQYRNIWIKYQ